MACRAIGKSHNVSTVKHNHHRNKSFIVGDIAVGEGRCVKLTTHINSAILFGTSTFHWSFLSTTRYTNLPAALDAELHAALASVHAVLPQRILYLGALFLFPGKMAKEWIRVLLLIVHALNHF